MSQIFDNHILFTSSNDIRDICMPLEEYFNITDFSYEKIYKDNSKIKLTNRPEWIRYYYQHGFHLIGDYEKPTDDIEPGYQLTSTLSQKEVFKSCRDKFNIDHGLVIVDKFEQYCEFFWFGSTRDNPKIIDFYLNNMDLLRRFTLYFKEKASHIIDKASKQRILIPPRKLIGNRESIIRERSKKSFVEAIRVKSYRLTGNYASVTLSEKEFECALGLIEGKTAHEIAKSLYRSPRTIETHIATMKQKLNCATKSKLIKVLLENGFSVYSNTDVIII